MQIAHIFNIINRNNKEEFITHQEFKTSYINNYLLKYQDFYNKNISDDYSKKYYQALEPIENKSVVSKYDNDKLHNTTDKLGDKILLIHGDFWGIQDFIFDGITSDKASKILRSRSAMVQLISFVISQIIKKAFNSSEVLLFNAGKFLILAKDEDRNKIDTIQKEIDRYFLDNFFGQSGFILSTQSTTKDNILNQNSIDMQNDLNSLINANEINSLNKFDICNLTNEDISKNIFQKSNSDDTICKFCSKRVQSQNNRCIVCDNQIKLGKYLARDNYISIGDKVSSHNILIFEYDNQKYYANFYQTIQGVSSFNQDIFDISKNDYDGIPKWSLNSYVAKDNDNEIIDFDNLSDKKRLFALKADIDKLGATFREFYMSSFTNFNRLSREIDFFFSDYASSLMSDKNIYTIFGGGDDLFIIGDYMDIIDFAKSLRADFIKFSQGKATISMGLVMFSPSTPINYISSLADEAEKRAKIKRDSIDIFGISIEFDTFIKIEDDFKEITDYLKSNDIDTTTFYFRLIELCDMKKDIQKDIKNAMWKSKLNYLIRRNIDKKDNDFNIFDKLSILIDDYDERFKPSIFLELYRERK